MENQTEIIINQLISAWDLQINRATKLFDTLTDEQLSNQVAPTKNTGTYLLGHLTAIHDAMFPLLGIGNRLYPELDEIFVKNPDSRTIAKPSVGQLRSYWKDVNGLLTVELKAIDPIQWLDRHNTVSKEEFKKEQNRNKLSILLSRTSHIAYHLGQIAFLKNQMQSD